ncbi:Ribosomal RNA small subunit methyltransferase C [Rubellimicrobium mesophilum DSM 19309]|uniref:Ribosomal RNA small subunit methyltransferase C n=1 Tax=Rubellimicrobium mesophilum DSM 19309 TaxID=442562 RepID=A0A017HJ46_9RHOB|nr:methyltransferase [Rubellimicrobium mesophilum]EYD74502.1 Ribosomal RNA small subunit methyltransferase C [Rubellimicrobium mesophilum DSM 19309]
MSKTRLLTALDGGLALPEGEILVLRPPMAMDLGALPAERVAIRHTFRPDRDAWAGAGWRVVEEAGPAGVALVCVPRSKTLARGLIAEAARLAPMVLVDGQRTDGVDSVWREVRARRGEVEGLTQGHGRLFWFAGGDGFEDWALPGPVKGADGLFSQPGVFSAEGADRGSLLLAEALPSTLPKRMADFGAGIGVLSLAVLARERVESVDLIEAERLALDCARLNVTDPRARFLWEDATVGARGPYDGIVMNPPFHAGRAADPGLGRAFLAAAAKALTPSGQLWVVANRHLPYEATLQEGFRQVAEIGGDAGFKLLHASQPVRAKVAARPSGVQRSRRHSG